MRAQQRERLPASARLRLGAAADQDHEHDQDRHGHEQDRPRDRVDREHPPEHRQRDHAREHQLRQVAREPRLQRVHALDRGGGQIARAHVGGAPVGAHDQQLPRQAAAQFGHHAGRSKATGELKATRYTRAREEDRRERDQLRGQRGQARTVDRRAVDHICEQRRLGDDQQRRGHSQQACEDHVRAGRTGLREQPALQRRGHGQALLGGLAPMPGIWLITSIGVGVPS